MAEREIEEQSEPSPELLIETVRTFQNGIVTADSSKTFVHYGTRGDVRHMELRAHQNQDSTRRKPFSTCCILRIDLTQRNVRNMTDYVTHSSQFSTRPSLAG